MHLVEPVSEGECTGRWDDENGADREAACKCSDARRHGGFGLETVDHRSVVLVFWRAD